MRERIFNLNLTVSAGLFFLGGATVVTVLLTEPTQSYWGAMLYVGLGAIAIGGALLLFLSWHSLRDENNPAHKRKMISALMITVGISLTIVGVFSWLNPDID